MVSIVLINTMTVIVIKRTFHGIKRPPRHPVAVQVPLAPRHSILACATDARAFRAIDGGVAAERDHDGGHQIAEVRGGQHFVARHVHVDLVTRRDGEPKPAVMCFDVCVRCEGRIR